MKPNVKTCAMMITLCVSSYALSAEQTVTYKNSRGSMLELNFSKQPVLTGSFTTAVASKDCQEAIGLKRPIIGYVDGTALTFSVHYPSCGSLVTLTGHINSDKDSIDTLALITHQRSAFTKGPGTHLITQDTFVKEGM